jgi:hypothetical protein
VFFISIAQLSNSSVDGIFVDFSLNISFNSIIEELNQSIHKNFSIAQATFGAVKINKIYQINNIIILNKNFFIILIKKEIKYIFNIFYFFLKSILNA